MRQMGGGGGEVPIFNNIYIHIFLHIHMHNQDFRYSVCYIRFGYLKLLFIITLRHKPDDITEHRVASSPKPHTDGLS